MSEDRLDGIDRRLGSMDVKIESLMKFADFTGGCITDIANADDRMMKRLEAIRAALKNLGHGDVFAYEDHA